MAVSAMSTALFLFGRCSGSREEVDGAKGFGGSVEQQGNAKLKQNGTELGSRVRREEETTHTQHGGQELYESELETKKKKKKVSVWYVRVHT
jgi:hypothetical protein